MNLKKMKQKNIKKNKNIKHFFDIALKYFFNY